MSEPSPCPICQAPVPADGKAVPFCSSRCRLIDLGRWADGRYAVAAAADPEDEDEEMAAPAPEDDD